MLQKVTDLKTVENLFAGWEETLIYSCLQGIMGKIYTDNIANPSSAMAILGDFVFFAGKPNVELVLYKPEWCTQDFIIMVPQNEEWEILIETYYVQNMKKVSRYAIKKEPHIFDKEKLTKIISTLPDNYELKMIDEEIYHKCKTAEWSRDLVAQYKDYGTYHRLGLGAVILKDGKVISGASSYSSYQSGIEIEIDTQENYRRQGLASICGAKLILECMKRHLYPSWDAQNTWSVGLAEKLGYHYSHTYTAYEIYDYGTDK